MSSLNDRIAHEVFDAHVRLVYSIAWRGVKRMMFLYGMEVPPVALEELVQDGVCRGMESFFRRVAKRGLPNVAKRRSWVAQCVCSGVKRACRGAKRAFGNEIPRPCYVDAMDRRGSLENHSFRHGEEDERDNALEQVHCMPVTYEVQRWEVEKLLEDERVPEKLRKTAVFATMGIGQEDSGRLQGCSERTVRNRLTELREYLDPPCQRDVYSVVGNALETAAADHAWTVRTAPTAPVKTAPPVETAPTAPPAVVRFASEPTASPHAMSAEVRSHLDAIQERRAYQAWLSEHAMFVPGYVLRDVQELAQ